MDYNYNECTTQALEEEVALLSEQYKAAAEALNKRKKEEADRQKAQLALEKQKREEEIREIKQKYDDLVQSFVRDYGHYHDENFWSWFARL